MGAFDFVIGFGKVVSAALPRSPQAVKEVVFRVFGIGGFGDHDQIADNQIGYGALGLIGWPRGVADQTKRAIDSGADVVYLKQGDELVPIAWRDLRLNRCFPAGIKEGTIALAGYGGGFLAFEDAPDTASPEYQDGNPATPEPPPATRATWYVPYARSGGTPTKAHAIILDPESEAVSIVHGDGFAVTMDPVNGITLRADGSTWLAIKPGKIELVAASIQARGNVALGADTSAALPLLPGVASQPTFSVYFSPV